MWEKIPVVGAYLAVLLGIGFVARRRARKTADDYFVASRTLPPWVLFLTMAATNFSAFTVFGVSGAGWRIGYAFYPIMAFGTGFMALTFYFIGQPVWQLGKEKGLLTPPELVFDRLDSPTLRLLFLGVMAAFTLPYLAMQPMAAGYALEELLGIPYFAGAALITGVMLIYTLFGGMRGVAWTDVFQGGMLIVLLLVALVIVAAPLGGLPAANQSAALRWPDLFSRPGMGGAFPAGIWLGYMLLWFFADPMFPQLFQRFYAARGRRALRTTMVMYPLITGILFLLPVTIGVLGRLTFPELPAGEASDRILPLLLGRFAPGPLEALILTAALAALMSTLDSQLLTLSSMFTQDLVRPLTGRLPSRKTIASGGASLRQDSPLAGKLFVVALALAGLGIAWRPPGTFLEIATEAFTGLAVLFPTVVAALYWPRVTAKGAIASILIGEGLVAAYHFQAIPTLGTLPVVPVVVASTLALIGVSLLTASRQTSQSVETIKPQGATQDPGQSRRPRRRLWAWTAAFVVLFVLGNDFWAWNDGRLGPLGFPWWVWYCLGLCGIMAAAFWCFSVHRSIPDPTPPETNTD